MLTLVLSILGIGSSIAADTLAEPLKIGILDWQQLLAKAPQAEEAGKRLEKEFQEPKDKLINKQKEFQVKRDKLQRDKDVMSSAERGRKEKELGKMEQELRRLDEELRGDIATRHREEMDEFVKIVKEVLDKFATEEKLDLILPQEATSYFSGRIDITDKILERLEKVAKSSKDKR